jgi:hypothetical protein
MVDHHHKNTPDAAAQVIPDTVDNDEIDSAAIESGKAEGRAHSNGGAVDGGTEAMHKLGIILEEGTLSDAERLEEEKRQRKRSNLGYRPPLTREHGWQWQKILRTAALSYIEAGFYVFPCRPVDFINQKGEEKKAKEPLVAGGFKAASNDPNQISRWWSEFAGTGLPNALIGLRTGLKGGIWVLDIDPKNDGIGSLKMLEAKFGPLPKTYQVRTPSGGSHYYFLMPDGVDLRNSGSKIAPGIDVRAEGGYVIAPPSMMGDGRKYEAISDPDYAWAPDWLIQLAISGGSEKSRAKIESRGWAHRRLAKECADVATAGEGTRNDTLNKAAFSVGILVGQEQLARNAAFDALLDAARKCGLEDAGAKATINSGLNAGKDQKSDQPQFPDWTKIGPRRDSIDNVRALLSHAPVQVRYNEFANRAEITGFKGYTALNDNAVDELWSMCHEFGFQTSQEHLRTSLRAISLEGSFHPVRDYFGALEWDGVKRIDEWLTTYLGAGDSEYVRHVGAKMLIAAARRIYRPGTKFDQMVVLEGAQGTGKSSALRILAVKDEWFTDNFSLTDDSRKVLEQTEGKFIIEAAEMTGIRKADIEHVKALLSRTEDRARKAYGHFVTEVPRQFIFVGTTNGGEESPYLVDPSGHRRSWPVKTGTIDLASLRRDVGQLWAEAVQRHQKGETIELPKRLWDAARQEQDKRALEDPWVLALEDGFGDMQGKVLSEDVWAFMGETVVLRRGQWANHNLGKAMRKLGWERKKLSHRGKYQWHYARGADPYPEITVSVLHGQKPIVRYAKDAPASEY